ncbi:MAG: hypothetical protein ACHQ0Y_15250 [Thermodesulfovibrionales bacterium]
MFNSTILEVAIGVVFVYWLLSLLCSALKEFVASVLAMRADTLEEGIRTLLNDPDAKGLAKELYDHPLIKGSMPAKVAPTLLHRFLYFIFSKLFGEGAPPQDSKPSYISPQTFSIAMLDIVVPAKGREYIGFDKLCAALADPEAKITVGKENVTLDEKIRKALVALVDSAQGDLVKARENIEKWFDDSMDRVSGWYKRKAQIIILFWAIILILLTNADTLMIANALTRDSTLRASVVAVAQKKAQPSSTGSAQEKSNEQQTAVAPASDAPKPMTPPGIKEEFTKVEDLQMELQSLKFLGWSRAEGNPNSYPRNFSAWLSKLAGLFLTVIAVSLGASFWFDALKGLINLRSAGEKPKKTGKT